MQIASNTCNHLVCFTTELTAPDAGNYFSCFFVKVTGTGAIIKPKVLSQIFVQIFHPIITETSTTELSTPSARNYFFCFFFVEVTGTGARNVELRPQC